VVVEEHLLHAVLVCLTEAVTNVVVHAYRDGVAGEVEIEARRPNGFLCLYVRDTGLGMVPRADSPGLGLGLPLIGDLTSDFAIRRCTGGVGTEIAMRFELEADAPPG
jgi:serine/threonine-protein kinase RsbW/stage II sporulation protein AB (anti-sigma F factor)